MRVYIFEEMKGVVLMIILLKSEADYEDLAMLSLSRILDGNNVPL
jgi:hypothetical protein